MRSAGGGVFCSLCIEKGLLATCCGHGRSADEDCHPDALFPNITKTRIVLIVTTTTINATRLFLHF